MKCPNCGVENRPEFSQCTTCGNPLAIYAVPVEPKKSRLIGSIVVAALAGLAAGGFLFYRTNRSASQAEDVSVVVPVGMPPPWLAVQPAEPKVETKRPAQRKTGVSSIARRVATPTEQFVPPQLIDPPPGTTQSSALPAPSPISPPVTVPEKRRPVRRPAVQDSGGDYSPMPVTADLPSAASSPAQSSARTQPVAAASASVTPAVRATVHTYTGPLTGTAIWTGKLGKDQTLTITGGTPSAGVLTGAGLPGAPVRITIEQSNLGFVEMPAGENGYRRLILRSHAKHDKIVIHWSVIQ